MNHNVAFDALAIHQRAMSVASGALDFKDSSQEIKEGKRRARRFARRRPQAIDSRG